MISGCALERVARRPVGPGTAGNTYPLEVRWVLVPNEPDGAKSTRTRLRDNQAEPGRSRRTPWKSMKANGPGGAAQPNEPAGTDASAELTDLRSGAIQTNPATRA
jgi:hypothetical protein